MIIVNVSGGKDSTACLLLALKQSLTYKYLDYLEEKLKLKIERVKSEKYFNDLGNATRIKADADRHGRKQIEFI